MQNCLRVRLLADFLGFTLSETFIQAQPFYPDNHYLDELRIVVNFVLYLVNFLVTVQEVQRLRQLEGHRDFVQLLEQLLGILLFCLGKVYKNHVAEPQTVIDGAFVFVDEFLLDFIFYLGEFG